MYKRQFAQRAQAAGAELVFQGHFSYEIKRRWFDDEFHAFHSEEFLVLPRDGVARLREDTPQSIEVERIEVGANGQAAQKFGDESVGFYVGVGDVLQEVVAVNASGGFFVEADHLGIHPACDELFDAKMCIRDRTYRAGCLPFG